MQSKHIVNNELLPVDVVFHPSWWYAQNGFSFDREFFFHPAKRVESEQRMEQVLYEKWGRYGLGENCNEKRPEVGPVHLAAGFILSEMMGCKVDYHEDSAPQVLPAHQSELHIDVEGAFRSPVFQQFERLIEDLQTSFGYVSGDINWGGVLNIAMDLRGERIFMDLFDQSEKVIEYFKSIGEVIGRFTEYLQYRTGSTSISVNRNVRNVNSSLFLHSECSHTMISEADYRNFLFPIDVEWSRRYRPFGIHYCGDDPHRFGPIFSELPQLDFLDAGWGGNIAELRKHLPNTFLNIRLSPVELIEMDKNEIETTIIKLVEESKNPHLTGVCCINIDHQVSDDKIDTIFETVHQLRAKYSRDSKH